MAQRGELVVFDLDGTPIDSRLDLAESNEMLGMRRAGAGSRSRGDGRRGCPQIGRARRSGGLDPAEPEALPRFLKIYGRRLLAHASVRRIGWWRN
jgi:hypothetical protein